MSHDRPVSSDPKPVLIVGAGPTGLVLAIELARRSVPFRLIDKRADTMKGSQAVFIMSRSLEILAGLGASEALHAEGQVVDTLDIRADAEPVAIVRFDDVDTPFPYILSVAEDTAEQVLIERLEALGGHVEWGTEFLSVEDGADQAIATLRFEDGTRQNQEAQFVVGTDGFRSAVRTSIHDAFDGEDHPQLWGVFDTWLEDWDQPHNQTCPQLSPPVVVAYPFGSDQWRVYFRTASADEGNMPMILERLRLISPNVSLRDPQAPVYFHSHSRLARHYRRGRVFVAGDAAHVSNPIQGQGMNFGIHDAHNLAWKLALAVKGHANEALLDSYEAERRPVAHTMVEEGKAAYQRLNATAPEQVDMAVDYLRSPNGPDEVAVKESGTAIAYENSPVIDNGEETPHETLCGCRVGDVDGLILHGQTQSLQQLIASENGMLLFLTGNTTMPPEDITALFADLSDDIRAPIACFVTSPLPATNEAGTSRHLEDPDGALHRRLYRGEPTFCHIRPDGFLGFRGTASDKRAMKAYLGRIYSDH